MTNPTPTRDEVERYSPLWSFGEMLECTDGEWVRFADYADLRERAEAAEQQCERNAGIALAGLRKCHELQTALAEARASEAAAWNDAIEAACNVSGHYMSDDSDETLLDMWREDIRALRRAAPTEYR